MHRAPFVVGRLDTYWAPTIGHVDTHLILLSALLEHPVKAATPERVRADIDALLDRRAQLAAADRPRPKEAA